MQTTQQKQRTERERILEIVKVFPDVVDEETKVGEKKAKRDQYGRPTVMTAQVIAKLEQASAVGCPFTEAAIFAGIHYATLQRYFDKHPHFRDRLLELQDHPVLAARTNVVHDIRVNKSVSTSFEYLKRKRRDEFAEKSELDIKGVPKLIAFKDDGDDDE